MERRAYWNTVYETKNEQELSWFEAHPSLSLQMMQAAGLNAETCVFDVGGGDSHLVDQLAARGLLCLAVLDVSEAALHRAQARLGSKASIPTWIEADVAGDWSLKPMDIWHDRAVLHFMTDPDDRRRYIDHLHETLKPGGSAIIATFALDGPEMCSGLPVVRYSPDSLQRAVGREFELVEAVRHRHMTPWGTQQSFQYCRFRRNH
jgi:2-polyprenyl-3-methyl-5-hydroxy-6-metoxy-1,4-benzoquinol methylase